MLTEQTGQRFSKRVVTGLVLMAPIGILSMETWWDQSFPKGQQFFLLSLVKCRHFLPGRTCTYAWLGIAITLITEAVVEIFQVSSMWTSSAGTNILYRENQIYKKLSGTGEKLTNRLCSWISWFLPSTTIPFCFSHTNRSSCLWGHQRSMDCTNLHSFQSFKIYSSW